jgi:hypothetical protein
MEKGGQEIFFGVEKNPKNINIFKEAFKMNEKSRNYENKVIEEFINITKRNKCIKSEGGDVKTFEFNSTIFKKERSKQKCMQLFEELLRDGPENLENPEKGNKNLSLTQRGFFFNSGPGEMKFFNSGTQTLQNKNNINTGRRPNYLRSLRNSSKSLARIMPSNVITNNSMSLLNLQNFPNAEYATEINKITCDTQRSGVMSQNRSSILNLQKENIENPEKTEKIGGVPIKVNRIFPLNKLKFPQKTICLNLNLNLKLNLQVKDSEIENKQITQKEKFKSRVLSEISCNFLNNEKDKEISGVPKKISLKENKLPNQIKKSMTPNNPQTKKISFIKQSQPPAKTARESKSKDSIPVKNKTGMKNNSSQMSIPNLKKSIPDYVKKYYKIAYNLNEEKFSINKTHNAPINKISNLNNMYDKYGKCDNYNLKPKSNLTSRIDSCIMNLNFNKDKNLKNFKIFSTSKENLIKLKNKTNFNVDPLNKGNFIKKV